MLWGGIFTHISDQLREGGTFLLSKKARIFSAGSVALIVLAVVFWNLVTVWAAQPSVINPIPDQYAMENVGFTFQFAANTFEDTEHTLIYTAELTGGMPLPAWLSFNAATRTFSGTPSNGDVETVTIDVIADDGNGANATDSFDIVVTNFNSMPIVANNIPNQSTNEDSPFNFQFAANTFSDPDIGDTLTYSAQLAGGGALPAWLSFNAATRTFSGTPLDADVGTISIDVTADDGNGGTIADIFSITVNNTNDPPTLANPIPDRTAPANNIFNFRFAQNTFNDDDGDSITYSVQLTGGGSLPAWLEYLDNWQTFRGTPSNNDIGSISIDVTADDGQGGITSDTFIITVVAAQAYSGTGNGLTKETAYSITDCEQLQEMSNNLGALYRLAGDIDCSDTVNWNGGAGFVPIGNQDTPFFGTLEGAEHTISGLTINRPTTDYVGLFGYIGAFISDNAVHRLLLEDISIRGQNYVGGVVGENRGVINRIGVTGSIIGAHIVGGAAGNNSLSILNTYSHAAISGAPGSAVAGGLVGQNGGFITNSYSTGVVPAGPGKGGLIGDDLGSGGVFNSFWDTQSSGTGISDEGTGKTTLEMKNVATFTDTQTIGLGAAWDFVSNPNNDTANDDIWAIDPLVNQGYPHLAVPAVPDTTIIEPPVSPPIHTDTAQLSPDKNVPVIQRSVPASASTSAQDTTNDKTITEHDTPNSELQPNTFTNTDDDTKKSETTDANSTSWPVGFLLIFLIVIAYFIHSLTRRGASK